MKRIMFRRTILTSIVEGAQEQSILVHQSLGEIAFSVILCMGVRRDEDKETHT